MEIFICKDCCKKLNLADGIYNTAYKGHDLCLDCRALHGGHGGKREGAGRPSLGTTKKVSITLPDEIWEKLEQHRKEQAMSAFLRELIMENYE
ncbi:hypothetical protein [Metabacillus idriensis]|uniref:hypothetical protein n=1 Tax=Metabacillus idriensis TaxID=324768 RepID=UPI001CD5A38D|nr:hypothetical protein [Metabacillus idriensis]